MRLLSVIIPCFNEEDNIPHIESELPGALKETGIAAEIIFVDDGSRDDTPELLAKLEAKHDFIKVAGHPQNLGLGSAIRTGLRESRGDAILTLDADLSFPPGEIQNLIRRYEEGDAECVIGSPYLENRGKLPSLSETSHPPFFRRLLSRGANLLYTVFLGTNVTFATGIFRLYNGESLRQLDLSSRGFAINAEILFRLTQKGARAVEIPATLTTRKHGTSKIRILPAIANHLNLIIRVLFWRIFP